MTTKIKGFRLSIIDQMMLKILAEKFKTNQTNIVKYAIHHYYEYLGETFTLPDEIDLIRQVTEVGYQKPDE